LKSVFDKLKQKGYTDEQFDAYVNNPNIIKVHGRKNLDTLRDMWYGKQKLFVRDELYDSMTKDQLDEYSINTYGIDLDKRFTKENMIQELHDELEKQEDDE
jgi:hypothetical protein